MTTDCNELARVCNGDYPVPAGTAWKPVGVSPLPQVPLGCGAQALPCNQGTFNFPWVPDSGQPGCFDNDNALAECPGIAGLEQCGATGFCGQDGQYGADVDEPAWADNRFVESEEVGGQPIVIDAWTGLVWQHAFQTSDWDQAVATCAGLGDWAGLTGWRLPSTHELMSLLEFGDAPVKSSFPDTPEADFWTADTRAEQQAEAWVVSFATGAVVADTPKTEARPLRCVTDVAAWNPGQRFYVANSGPGEKVVFDSRSGLLWQRSTTGSKKWQEALQHCEALTYAERDDWRLPNVLELASLLDTTRWVPPFIDAEAFPFTPAAPFHTSTTVAETTNHAWKVHFDAGSDRLEWISKDAELDVRCVTDAP